MAKTGVLSELADNAGVSQAELVIGAIYKEGSILNAAISLGVAPNTLQYFLRTNGYRLEKRPVIINDAGQEINHHD